MLQIQLGACQSKAQLIYDSVYQLSVYLLEMLPNFPEMYDKYYTFFYKMVELGIDGGPDFNKTS